MIPRTKHIIYLPIVFLLGGLIGIFLNERDEVAVLGQYNNLRGSSLTFDAGRLTNPLLDCAELSNFSNKKVNDAKSKVKEIVDSEKMVNHISDAAVYFRDLNNGPWFGIGERTDFYPASLLKVPLMMAVYKQAMAEPGFLDKKIEVVEDGFNDMETIKSDHYVKKGEVKTIKELLEYMIKYSDNNALYALNKNLDQNIFKDTYRDIGVALPEDPEYVISVRTYSSFFRILYNATYLWEPYSQKALELLTESDFKDGLVAGVPENVKVAHKFGERELNGGQRQLHDCGIVYGGTNPYVLCVMTRGKDPDQLINVIKNISKTVYDTLLQN